MALSDYIPEHVTEKKRVRLRKELSGARHIPRLELGNFLGKQAIGELRAQTLGGLCA